MPIGGYALGGTIIGIGYAYVVVLVGFLILKKWKHTLSLSVFTILYIELLPCALPWVYHLWFNPLIFILLYYGIAFGSLLFTLWFDAIKSMR